MSLDIYLTERCSACGHANIHNQNITHNLTDMAKEASIYKMLWCGPENGYITATQWIEPLSKAIDKMEADPNRFKKHDSPNGWGLYKHFLPWLKELLEECKKTPNANIEISK